MATPLSHVRLEREQARAAIPAWQKPGRTRTFQGGDDRAKGRVADSEQPAELKGLTQAGCLDHPIKPGMQGRHSGTEPGT
jgi:hypothetical protein